MQAVRSSTGQLLSHMVHAVSDAFVVATQRVKQAQKSSIPHMEEHVSKLDFVGVQTQLKLQDIKGAAAQSGVVGLSVIHNNITTGETRRSHGVCFTEWLLVLQAAWIVACSLLFELLVAMSLLCRLGAGWHLHPLEL